MLQWTQLHCDNIRIHGYLINKLLTKCGNNKESLMYIHTLIDSDFFVGHCENIQIQNELMNSYGRCKDDKGTLSVFDAMLSKDEISLSVMMKVFLKTKQNKKILKLYQKYDSLHSEVTDMLSIKACINMNDIQNGRSIIDKYKNKKQKIKNIQLSNTLIDFYGHFGDIYNAKCIYQNVANDRKNTATINAMMKAYIHCKQYEDALNLYDDILRNEAQIKMNDVIHSLAIKSCAMLKNLQKGKQIHAKLQLNDPKKSRIKDALIDFYFRCNDMDTATEIFDAMEMKTIRNINAMMKGYVHLHHNEKALALYDGINIQTKKDEVSHLFAIKACIQSGNLMKGEQIHQEEIGNEFGGIAIQNALIEFYSHFDKISHATQVFESLSSDQKIFSIGSMMKMYINYDEDSKALQLYKLFNCNQRTYENVPHVLAIKACTKTLDTTNGREIGLDLANNQCIEVQNALINFYGDVGHIDEAKAVFERIKFEKKDIVSMSCMMKAFINNNLPKEALKLYDNSQFIKDDIVHTLAIKACGDIGDLSKGKRIHFELMPTLNAHDDDDDDNKLQLKNALIKFYGDCMDVQRAQNVFDSISEHQRDAISINCMMKAYIDNDYNQRALQLYDDVMNAQLQKDEVCNMLVLSACINLEQYARGKEIISANINFSSIQNIKLKTTLIDFYGHCNDISAALNMFDSIPNFEKHIVTISAMMEAYLNCNLHTECIQLFENMRSFNPDLQPEIGCFVTALKACTSGTILHVGELIYAQ